ncbi:hypothetical protein ACFQVD_26880 [Streptosporangium amethystogenes subsp. fukuiense]|uniref:Uncharacterized protein n=1 Tax=Streptosporangium amethystogenes subsp. fukuiense TaxID=698418 RepID=A0ABW2T7Q4_9ACTN
MTEYERDWHQEDKDDRAQGLDCEPEPPERDEEGPLDREELDEAIGCIDDGRVRSAIRRAFAELEDWRGRTHRYEYTTTEGDAAPTWSGDRHPREKPGYTPWVRTVSTSDWRRYEAPPF